MRKVQFTETVLRDANQSLIATRLPYSKFEPILETMDKAGFYSAEVWGGAPLTYACAICGRTPGSGCARSAPRCPTPSCRCCSAAEHPGL